MAIVINGSGTVTGLAVGGLPDGTVDAGTVAADVATQAEIDAKLNLSGGTMTGNLNIIQATSGTGSSAVKELIYNEGAGDAALHLALSGSTDWYVGADNTDNSLKIGQASWDSSPYLAIDTNGAVTMPSQPAFYVGSVASQLNIALDTSVTVVMTNEIFDLGSNFASNTFTAPVTGKYQLTANMRLDSIDSAANYYSLRIVTSNRNHLSLVDPDYGADLNYAHFSLSVLADMDAGDTAYFAIVQSGGSAQSDIDGDTKYTNFSGYLVA